MTSRTQKSSKKEASRDQSTEWSDWEWGNELQDEDQFSENLNQLSLEGDGSDESEDGATGTKAKSRRSQGPRPFPEPGPPINCNHGCIYGPNRDPDGAEPRPPPSAHPGSKSSSKSESRHSYRGSQSKSGSKSKGSSDSKGGSRRAINQKANEPSSDHEFEDEIDSAAEKDMMIWKKEYETWKDVTCACGFGYYTILGEWVSGSDVRAGRMPPKPTKVQPPAQLNLGVRKYDAAQSVY